MVAADAQSYGSAGAAIQTGESDQVKPALMRQRQLSFSH
jgi:hypothetical protein